MTQVLFQYDSNRHDARSPGPVVRATAHCLGRVFVQIRQAAASDITDCLGILQIVQMARPTLAGESGWSIFGADKTYSV